MLMRGADNGPQDVFWFWCITFILARNRCLIPNNLLALPFCHVFVDVNSINIWYGRFGGTTKICFKIFVSYKNNWNILILKVKSPYLVLTSLFVFNPLSFTSYKYKLWYHIWYSKLKISSLIEVVHKIRIETKQ